MDSEIVHIFVILGCTRFLIICLESITPLRICFCFLDSITSNKLIHIYFYISDGGWSSLRSCSKQQISLIRYFHDHEYCTYICYFGLHPVFNHVPAWHPTPRKFFFFWFLDSITSNKLIHIYIFLIFLGGG